MTPPSSPRPGRSSRGEQDDENRTRTGDGPLGDGGNRGPKGNRASDGGHGGGHTGHDTGGGGHCEKMCGGEEKKGRVGRWKAVMCDDEDGGRERREFGWCGFLLFLASFVSTEDRGERETGVWCVWRKEERLLLCRVGLVPRENSAESVEGHLRTDLCTHIQVGGGLVGTHCAPSAGKQAGRLASKVGVGWIQDQAASYNVLGCFSDTVC